MSRSALELVSPRAAALRILAARYATHAAQSTSYTYSLAAFQQEAVARARAIMQVRGGVILADSVGLGKTYIAAALIELGLAANQPCVVVVPAAVRGMWQRELRPLLERHAASLSIVSHGQLSCGLVVSRNGLVVVDEAHVFRSPHTRRYRSLRRSCAGSRVLLLTATPVNNSLSDLYFQLRLFAADNAFRDLGIGSLAALLRTPETDKDALQRLRRAVIIRRTRGELRARFQRIELPNGEQLRFPRVVQLHNTWYTPGTSIQNIGAQLSEIRFAPYANEITAILLRLSLLKRLQSSQRAMTTSLERLIAFYERYLSSLDSGRVLKPRLLSDVAGEQLVFLELLVEAASSAVPLSDLRNTARTDLELLQSLRDAVGSASDHKLDRLIQVLNSRRAEKTVVFTEFVDTAEQLWRRLHREFRTGLVTGHTALLGAERVHRSEIIRRFAPRSNGIAPPRAHEAVNVLIATDVLAEGLNLQDADAVISYDLPWNPVRLIQRAGRVDRIGSPHDVVHVYNFMPDREFDAFLGLVRTLRAKLLQMRGVVGQENAVLEPNELDLDFMAALQSGSNDLLDEERADMRFAEAKLNLDDAAPMGSVAALPGEPKRVLVCWSRGAETREVVVTETGVCSDSRAADAILEQALQYRSLNKFGAVHAIDRARQYVDQEFAFSMTQPSVLAREIQNAVRRLGLLASEQTVLEANAAIEVLPGYLGNTRRDREQIRSATTPESLIDALAEIRRSCTVVGRPENPILRLVAAISAD